MRLIVRTEDNEIVAVEDLDPLLEDGTFAVRLDAVSRVLDGIRVAADALVPDDSARREANPARMARVAQIILSVSTAAKQLATTVQTTNPNRLIAALRKARDENDPAARAALVDAALADSHADDKDAASVLGALSQLHL
jgi:hypothetical protein